MPDFNNPISTQGYLALLADIVANNKAALQWLDGVTPLTNLPTGAKRWSAGNARFEQYNGSTWAALASLFEMKVRNSDQLNGYTESSFRNAGNLSAGYLPGARFNDGSHGSRGGGSLHALATTSTHGFMSSTQFNKLASIENNATGDQTGAEILALLLSEDGAGSGLDGDRLDGQHGSYYRSRANHTGTQPLSTISDAGPVAALSSISAPYLASDVGSRVILDKQTNYTSQYYTNVAQITSSYDEYELVVMGMRCNDPTEWIFQFGDSGGIETANYSWWLTADINDSTYPPASNSADSYINLGGALGGFNDYRIDAVIRFFRPTTSGIYHAARWEIWGYDEVTPSNFEYMSGVGRFEGHSNALDRIRFGSTDATMNTTGGTIILYGINK